MPKTDELIFKDISSALERSTYIEYNNTMFRVLSYNVEDDFMYAIDDDTGDEYEFDNACDIFNDNKNKIYVLEEVKFNN